MTTTRSISESADRNFLYRREIRHIVHRFVQDAYPLAPGVIIETCIRFYDETVYWDLSGSSYDAFMSCQVREAIMGPMFSVMGIDFQFKSYPCGEMLQENGFVQMYLVVTKFPPIIETLHLYFELYCEQTGVQFRRAKIFCLQDISREPEHAWGAHCAPLVDCQSLKHLTFGARVNVQHIEYTALSKTEHVITPVPMHVRYSHEWIITNSTIDRMKKMSFQQHVYSGLFDNDSWCLCCMPNGSERSEQGSLLLGLVLYKMPFGVYAMNVKYELKCKETQTEWCTTEEFMINKSWKYTAWPGTLFETKLLEQHKQLTFTVCLEILALKCKQRQQIPNNLWPEYGIIQEAPVSKVAQLDIK